MADNVHALRPTRAGGDAEKITINLGYVDLGHVDLLVQDGFYANRTDFIRTAIRNQIERHADAARQSVARRNLDLGLRHYGRAELEAARAAGRPLDIRVLGLASIAPDVTPELARAAIAEVIGFRSVIVVTDVILAHVGESDVLAGAEMLLCSINLIWCLKRLSASELCDAAIRLQTTRGH